MFSKDELNRIAKTLEQDIVIEGDEQKEEEDYYYVYMLCTEAGEKVKPFYIGKGKGSRVFQHESDAEEVIKAIEEAREEYLDKEVSDKIKTIIENKGEICKYIIKWGLTSQEAFMCESSLINIYNLLYPGVLTNIKNGHSTEKERNCRSHTTKAYRIEDFLKEVCIEEVNYEDTELVNKKVMFIQVKDTLKNYYKDCSIEKRNINYEDYVYQCTQGYWRYKLETAQKADYVVALQSTVIRGIYPLDKWLCLEDLRCTGEAPMYPILSRQMDNKTSDPKVLERIGFYKKDESTLSDVQMAELELLKSQLLNKMIKEKNSTGKNDWFKEQNSTYNYYLKGNEVVIRKIIRK